MKEKAFSLRPGIRQELWSLPFLFNVVLEFLARAIKQYKEIKDIVIGKADIKLSLFVNDAVFEIILIFYVEVIIDAQ